MSFFAAEVINLPEPIDHPNADNLFIFQLTKPLQVNVIGNKDSWRGKTKAVYCMIDSVFPQMEEYEFLGSSRRLKAKRLRGIYSAGMLLPAEDSWEVGQDVKDVLGITKYVEPAETMDTSYDSESGPQGERKYTDIENIKRFPDVFQEGEPIVLMEKLHGCCGAFCWSGNRLYCGSRRRWVKDGKNAWWDTARKTGLADKICDYPDYIFFGEVLGVQDLKYNNLPLKFFDVYSIAEARFLNYNEMFPLLNKLGLEMVPVLYEGPWLGLEKMADYAEGKSTLAEHVREGWVGRPAIQERYDLSIDGRCVLKCVGADYTLRKQK